MRSKEPIVFCIFWYNNCNRGVSFYNPTIRHRCFLSTLPRKCNNDFRFCHTCCGVDCWFLFSVVVRFSEQSMIKSQQKTMCVDSALKLRLLTVYLTYACKSSFNLPPIFNAKWIWDCFEDAFRTPKTYQDAPKPFSRPSDARPKGTRRIQYFPDLPQKASKAPKYCSNTAAKDLGSILRASYSDSKPKLFMMYAATSPIVPFLMVSKTTSKAVSSVPKHNAKEIRMKTHRITWKLILLP